MLIIPLHRAPTRANFPWVTLALILANVFVFAFLQSGDARVQERALDHYVQQGLAHWEFPVYRDWLRAHVEDQQRRELFERFAGDDPAQSRHAVQVMQSDAAFLADLRAEKLISPQSKDFADWRERRTEFDRLWNSAFTERWMIHFSDFDLGRMFGAMFLHAGLGHLLGNMLFLALLGLLVEGALGHGLFLAFYLLGGLGSAAISLWWRWGELGGALGASGAIAALMGAYCVLWGARRVRFFWWFFVVFDYVKAPALVLLPFWLGWELVNLFWNKGAHVGFDAHAGGIIVGALLALGVRMLHWEQRDFLEEDNRLEVAADDRAALAKAREHIGRLEIRAARDLLEPVVARHPDDFDALVALYRCARCEPRMPRLSEAAQHVLAFATRTATETREQKGVHDDYLKTGRGTLPLTLAQTIALARRWPAIGAGADAARLLENLLTSGPLTAGLDAACLGVARDLSARGETATARTLLERMVAVCPRSLAVEKARLLLTADA